VKKGRNVRVANSKLGRLRASFYLDPILHDAGKIRNRGVPDIEGRVVVRHVFEIAQDLAESEHDNLCSAKITHAL
jgi:hypothetical protein